jgi:hypothetical protein
MQAEISLNTETLSLRQKFRLRAMSRGEQTRALHKPHSEGLVGQPEIPPVTTERGWVLIKALFQGAW